MNLSTRTSRTACALAIFAVTLSSSAPAFSIDQVTDRLAESRGGGITAPFGSVDLSSNVSGYNRPVTLPSYPDRPQSESQRPRPPVYRPSQHRPQWGYVYPTGNKYCAGTVRCESFGSRYRSCIVPTTDKFGKLCVQALSEGRRLLGRLL